MFGNKKLEKGFDNVMKRLDGWSNILTGLGLSGTDKRLAADIAIEFLDQSTVEALYQKDDVAARIIDRPVEEMFKMGYTIKIENDDDKKIENAFIERKGELFFDQKLKQSIINSRLYGGSGIIIGIAGQEPEEELNLEDIKHIDYLTVLDRYQLSPSLSLIQDLGNHYFGFPETYSIVTATDDKLGASIHNSRIIRTDGVLLPTNLRAQNSYWGDSVLSRVYNAVRNYQGSHDSVATIITDFTVMVIKMKQLSSLIASGEESLVTKRLELATLMSSMLHAIVIEEGEEYERKTTNVAGLKDLVDKVENRLVAATDMPHTIILGESPTGGLANTGNSEMTQWFDHVKSLQEAKMLPGINYMADIIFSEKAFVTKGKIPRYKIEFNPLWQLDEKEKAEITKITSEADSNYIDRGALTIDEVRNSRWGGDEYSIKTNIDKDLDMELKKETENDA